jgi:hypothetical protein
VPRQVGGGARGLLVAERVPVEDHVAWVVVVVVKEATSVSLCLVKCVLLL